MVDTATPYSVLSLSPDSVHSPQDIKAAYHAALLLHHPDKSQSAPRYTIDQITEAYKVLTTPTLRHELDLSLRLRKRQTHESTGERVDLEDLQAREQDGKTSWVRACRCGVEDAFVVTEADLEDAWDKGHREVVVECRGCSLHLTVGFAAVEESTE